MADTRSRRKLSSAIGLVALSLVLVFCAAEYYVDFPWHLKGGVNYDAAVSLYIKKIISEHLISIGTGLFFFIYPIFLFDRIVGQSPSPARARLANGLVVASTFAAAGLALLYGAMGFLMLLHALLPH